MIRIAIVPYVTNGRNSQAGYDGHFNIFQKKRSTVLKENLLSVTETKNWKAEVIVDVNHGDLRSLKREGLIVTSNYFVLHWGRERCDRKGHAVFLRP